MDWTTDRSDAPAAQRADMVGVHFEADTIVSARVDALIAGHGTYGFGEHHRSATMQQAIRLVSAGIDHHAGGKGVVTDGFEPNIEQFGDGVLAVSVELFEFRKTVPNAQVSLSMYLI